MLLNHMIAGPLLAVTLLLPLQSVQAGASAAPSAAEKAKAQAEIWTKEQAIYASRGRGDISAYLANTATGYLAWAPLRARPEGNAGLKQTGRELEGKNQEELAMHFADFSMNGDTAIIYYDTHRTRRADGTPVDERFEVTHTWVREDGEWKVFGGMARATPSRPAPAPAPASGK